MAREPALTGLLSSTFSNNPTFRRARYRIGQRLAGDELSAEVIARLVFEGDRRRAVHP